MLTDPTYLRKEMDVKKKSSIYDIQISADHLMVHGFHDLKLSFIRVIRHYGVCPSEGLATHHNHLLNIAAA